MRRFFREHNKAFAAVIFFLAFAFLDGPFFEADSESYLIMHVFREPGYPLFLQLCSRLPGAALLSHEGYAGLWYALFLQSLLWAYASYQFVLLAEAVFINSGCDGKHARTAGWIALALQFAVCLLNRFASGRGALYSNSILTESLAMPLYTLFICYLFYLLRDGGRRNLFRCALCALVMIMIRKHMTVTLLIWGFAVFVIRLLMKTTRQIREFFVHCAVILTVFLASQVLTRCYNLALYNTFAPQAGRSEGMMCMLLYTAEEADAERFREEEAAQKTWFSEIALKQKEQGARYADVPAGEGWIGRFTYFADRYDVIGYGIVHDILFEAAEERLGADAPYHVRTREMYELEATLLPALLRQDLRDYVRVYTDNLVAGLAYSNARFSKTLLPVSALMYVLYVVLFALSFRGREKKEPVILLAFLVLSGLLINAATVAAFIFSQPRYDTYGMAMFYTLIVLMVWIGIKAKRGGR